MIGIDVEPNFQAPSQKLSPLSILDNRNTNIAIVYTYMSYIYLFIFMLSLFDCDTKFW